MAKSIYKSPLIEAITFAPEERIMEKIAVGGSGSGHEPGMAPARGPERNINVMYI